MLLAMGRKGLLRKRMLRELENVSEAHELSSAMTGALWEGLTLELGCGRGELSLALAEKFPEKRFVGVDKRGKALYFGAREALSRGLHNLFFIRGEVLALERIILPGSVSEIWIPFPEPQPKPSKAQKRLTSPRYLALYRKVLGGERRVILKTDSQELIAYTLAVLDKEGGEVEKLLSHREVAWEKEPLLHIQTKYERRHLAEGRELFCLQFVLP